MKFKLDFWLKFSIVNLLLVALLGTIMRYKIGFDFPFLNYKNILHSHSHFAFAGWISHTLMVLMVYFLKKKSTEIPLSKYSGYIIANLITAYGMLITFTIQGYAFWSILFSTLSIFVSYGFVYCYFKDLKRLDKNIIAKKWFSGALFFYVISSIGPFVLAYMMATKNIVQVYHLSSVYYYLHFQYNGWFFFVCMGLLCDSFQFKSTVFNKVFPWFFTSCILSFFLSLLWMDLPKWLFVISVISALVQLVLWVFLLIDMYKKSKKELQIQPFFLQNILRFIAFCVSLKFVIQLLSGIPSLNKLVYGFRFIIIAYLHLVLLAIISLYLLYYIYSNKLLPLTKTIKNGLIGFVVGVFLNELILAIQGFSAFGYILIPKVNEMLFGASLIMLTSLIFVVFPSLKKKAPNL